MEHRLHLREQLDKGSNAHIGKTAKLMPLSDDAIHIQNSVVDGKMVAEGMAVYFDHLEKPPQRDSIERDIRPATLCSRIYSVMEAYRRKRDESRKV